MSERTEIEKSDPFETEATHNIIANLLTAKLRYTVTAQDVYEASLHDTDKYNEWTALADGHLKELAEKRVERTTTITIPDQRIDLAHGSGRAVVIETVDFDPVL